MVLCVPTTSALCKCPLLLLPVSRCSTLRTLSPFVPDMLVDDRPPPSPTAFHRHTNFINPAPPAPPSPQEVAAAQQKVAVVEGELGAVEAAAARKVHAGGVGVS